jgi:hypothetical protein
MFSKVSTLLKTHSLESFLAFFCLIVFVLETINQRLWMNDFRVYWSASQAILGDGQIYGKAFGLDSGFYKYSPLAALLFVPLGLLPFAFAKTIYYIASSVAAVGLFAKLRQLEFFKNADFSTKTNNWMLVILLILNAPQLFRELHLGNTNMILLFVSTSALLLISRQPNTAGLLIGLSILFKPHFVLILPLLLLRRRFQTLVAVVFTLILGLLLPFLVVGWQGNLDLITSWWQSIAQHNASLASAKDNLAYILFSLLGQQSPKVYFWIEIFVILVLAILVFAVVVKHKLSEKRHSRNTLRKHFQSEYLLLLAIIPTMFITDTEHFLLAIPLICLLIFKAWLILSGTTHPILKLDQYFLIVLGLALGLFLISDFVASNSMLGIGNALLIILFGLTQLLEQKPKRQPK